jgi:hypothetical protein
MVRVQKKAKRSQKQNDTKIPPMGRREVHDSKKALELLRSLPKKSGIMNSKNH